MEEEASLIRDPYPIVEPAMTLTTVIVDGVEYSPSAQAETWLTLREQTRVARLLEMTETERYSIVLSLAKALGPASPRELADLERFSEEREALAA